MKKLLATLILFLFSFSSCYIEDSYPCFERISYLNYNINKFYTPAVVKINFSIFCPNNEGYYLLVEDPFYGTEFINGTWWRYASGRNFNSPIITYIGPNYLLSYRYYKCVIVSTNGNYSEEFYISTY